MARPDTSQILGKIVLTTRDATAVNVTNNETIGYTDIQLYPSLDTDGYDKLYRLQEGIKSLLTDGTVEKATVTYEVDIRQNPDD